MCYLQYKNCIIYVKSNVMEKRKTCFQTFFLDEVFFTLSGFLCRSRSLRPYVLHFLSSFNIWCASLNCAKRTLSIQADVFSEFFLSSFFFKLKGSLCLERLRKCVVRFTIQSEVSIFQLVCISQICKANSLNLFCVCSSN